MIEKLVFAPELHFGLDERGLLGAPEQLIAEVVDSGIGERDSPVHFAVDDFVGVVRQHLRAALQAYLQCKRQGKRRFRAALDESLAPDLPALEMGRPAEAIDVSGRNAFVPHGLPDTGRARIPDAMGLELPVLLAPRLGEVGRVVLDAHRDPLVRAGGERGRDIGRKRRMPALMADDEVAVHPDLGLVVDGPEVQDHPVIRPPRARV